MKEYTQADWDEYAEWAAEAAKVPYEELDAPWIVVNRGPDDIHPARSKWEAYQIAKSLNYSFESFLMVNPDTAEDALRADIWDGDPEDIPPTMEREAELAVAAAEPYLRKKWAEELVERKGEHDELHGKTDGRNSGVLRICNQG